MSLFVPLRKALSRPSFLILTFSAIALGFAVFAGSLIRVGSAQRLQKSGASQSKSETARRNLHPNLDVRVGGQGRLSRIERAASTQIAERARAQAAAIQEGLARLRATVPSAEAKLSPITGAVEVLRSPGALTGPNPGRAGTDIVRDFIEANSAVYGLGKDDVDELNFLGESVSRASGLRMVRVEQVVNGLPVFQSETRFILDRDGRVVRSTGLMVPKASDTAPSLDNLLSAQAALRSAMASVDIQVNEALMTLTETNSDGTKTEVIAKSEQIAGNVHSKLVFFPLAPGVLIPAWSQITFTNGDGDWYTLTDATSGELLWRKNIRNYASTHQARFSVYVQADGKTPADNPAPQSPSAAVPGGGTQFPEIARTTVNMLTVQDILASQNGWIDDCPGGVCGAGQTQTIGNNVHAYLDQFSNNVPDTDPAGVIDGNGKPTGNPDVGLRNRDFLGTTPRDYTMLPPPQGGNPEAGQTATGAGSSGTNVFDAFRRGAITQLFYVCNWYHDQLFQLGFDEAAGNFQQTNFSGMGAGNDRLLAEAQDGGGTNNANSATPPDGTSGRVQMFIWTGPTIDRDGALDTEILVHELAHGTSQRLIGNAAGLAWDPGAAMGEGWSDFYALSLLNNTNADNPNANYAAFAYDTYKIGGSGFLDNYVYGLRRFPYSTNNSVNPMTWADVDETTASMSGGIAVSPLGFEFAGAMEVHNAGEVWGLSLWEVRSRIIAANANDVPIGNNKMLEIVTDGMKMTPLNPSFTEARDALVDADCAANACANEQSIWDGFADRGLGYNASAPLGYGVAFTAMHMGIKESFLAPYLDVNAVTVDDSFGNGNGNIDPGEAIRITVSLKNPWRNVAKGVASATATLSSSTPGVVITHGNSTYPGIAAQGNANGTPFRFNVPANAVCGQSLKFTITPTSTLGSQAVDFVLRVGGVSGTGAPITYTSTNGAQAIPDDDPLGVTSTLTITDDFEIADLNFRANSITHTFPDDLMVMLKGPTSYGTDFIAFIGLAGPGGGSGDNVTNMVIDDGAAGNQLLATTAQAPYTGSWRPIFNSPTWASFNPPLPPDPVGELSRFNGTSTAGVWRLLVADEFAVDTGTLNANGWSIIVTPRTFTCTPPVPTAAPATISGRITAPDGSPLGGTVMRLTGATSRTTVSDSDGHYHFDNVGTENFYTVTPGLANYSFSPASRSFSLTGNMTDAGFTGNPDATQSANAIDTVEYFVRQQYLDFLGREPDQGGLEYWSSQFDVCNGHATCIRNKRIDVSAAFFASLEFQQTGSYVYGLYAGMLGRTPGYGEFMPDRAQVVGGSGLDPAKTAFAQSFVQRSEFTNRYPQSMTREQFVDAVIQTMSTRSGVDHSSLRNQLLGDYDTGGRALVARHASEASAFVAAEYNKAFVLMEYFGYLRRDIDPGGYAFWLDVLTNTAGDTNNYRGMVCAFLTSTEYQHRFSTVVTHSNAECGQ